MVTPSNYRQSTPDIIIDDEEIEEARQSVERYIASQQEEPEPTVESEPEEEVSEEPEPTVADDDEDDEDDQEKSEYVAPGTYASVEDYFDTMPELIFTPQGTDPEPAPEPEPQPTEPATAEEIVSEVTESGWIIDDDENISFERAEDQVSLNTINTLVESNDILAVQKARASGRITNKEATAAAAGISLFREEREKKAIESALKTNDEIYNAYRSGATGQFEKRVLQHLEMQRERDPNLDVSKMIQSIKEQLRGQAGMKSEVLWDLNAGRGNLVEALDYGIDPNEILRAGYNQEDVVEASRIVKTRDEILFNHNGNVFEAIIKSPDIVNESTLGLLYNEEFVKSVTTLTPFTDIDGNLDPLKAIESTIPEVVSLSLEPLDTSITDSLRTVYSDDFVDTLLDVKDYIEEVDGKFNINIESFIEDAGENYDLISKTLTRLGYSNVDQYIEDAKDVVKMKEATKEIQSVFYESMEEGDITLPEATLENIAPEKILTLYTKEDGDKQVLLNFGFEEELVDQIAVMKDYITADGSVDILQAAIDGFSKEELISAGVTEVSADRVILFASDKAA